MFINKKVLIVVPDGVGIKNYLYSKLPKTLSESSELFDFVVQEKRADTITMRMVRCFIWPIYKRSLLKASHRSAKDVKWQILK